MLNVYLIFQTKRNFEKQLEEFDILKAQFESNKLAALEMLKQQHEKEVEQLRNLQNEKHGTYTQQQEEMMLTLQGEINLLQEKCEQLTADNKQNAEDFEHKLSKAQAFYEKELAAARQSQNSSFTSQLCDLEGQNDKLKKDLVFMEGQYKKRVDDLVAQLAVNEVEMNKYKSNLEKLESSLKEKDGDSSLLNKQVKELY